MKHLKIITVLLICSFLTKGSESKKTQEKNDSFFSDLESTASNDSLAIKIVSSAISKNLNSTNSTNELEEYAKKGNLEGFATALAEGKKASEIRWVHSVHYDPTKRPLLGFIERDPWIIEKVNLQEFLKMSATTCSAGLISCSTAEKMLKMLDISSTKEWSCLSKEDRFSRLMIELSNKENKA